jgi:excisionase family DNA binding protein
MPNEQFNQRVLTVGEFIRAYRLGRTSTYKLINNGSLRTIRIGKRRLIPVDAAEQLLKQENLSLTSLAS